MERMGERMKVERMDVMAFTITDVDRLDPIRVMIENYEPGKGRITITCFGKACCCDYGIGNELLELFGDDPCYARWPSVPNPNYQYLDRIVNAVRVGLVEMERAV